VAVLVISVATLLTADQPVPRDHSLRSTDTAEKFLPGEGSGADVFPQNQKLGIILKLDQTHLPSTVHLLDGPQV